MCSRARCWEEIKSNVQGAVGGGKKFNTEDPQFAYQILLLKANRKVWDRMGGRWVAGMKLLDENYVNFNLRKYEEIRSLGYPSCKPEDNIGLHLKQLRLWFKTANSGWLWGRSWSNVSYKCMKISWPVGQPSSVQDFSLSPRCSWDFELVVCSAASVSSLMPTFRDTESAPSSRVKISCLFITDVSGHLIAVIIKGQDIHEEISFFSKILTIEGGKMSRNVNSKPPTDAAKHPRRSKTPKVTYWERLLLHAISHSALCDWVRAGRAVTIALKVSCSIATSRIEPCRWSLADRNAQFPCILTFRHRASSI